jgi:hypothetical protein
MTDRPDYRGVVDTSDEMTAELAVLAKLLPLGTRIRHRSGRVGTVVIDQPPHVPGMFDGRPTAWCFANEHSDEALVCASWDNDRGFDRWICWTSINSVQRVKGGTRFNRPAAKAGAR